MHPEPINTREMLVPVIVQNSQLYIQKRLVMLFHRKSLNGLLAKLVGELPQESVVPMRVFLQIVESLKNHILTKRNKTDLSHSQRPRSPSGRCSGLAVATPTSALSTHG